MFGFDVPIFLVDAEIGLMLRGNALVFRWKVPTCFIFASFIGLMRTRNITINKVPRIKMLNENVTISLSYI